MERFPILDRSPLLLCLAGARRLVRLPITTIDQTDRSQCPTDLFLWNLNLRNESGT